MSVLPLIRPHVAELAMPEGPERSRRLALRALRDCGVVRVTLGAVPRGYRILQTEGAITVKRAGVGQADCRLTKHGEYIIRVHINRE